ncbi:MAG: DUF2975 domain-containing protein [Balneolaceae bacterium]|nr:DUF2975 domain-containing protein [Balneolaceae bacterium]
MYWQSGDALITSVPKIDPLVRVNNLELEPDEIESMLGTHALPIEIFTRIGVMTLEEDLSAYNQKIYVARLFKYTTLLCFMILLARVLKTVSDKNPFDHSNSKRLLKMGVLVMCFGLFDVLSSYTFASALNEIGFKSDIVFRTVYEPLEPSIYVGLVLILLGFVFKEATRIHEELKLTV